MKILIIEDEVKIANSIKQGLEQENFSVEVAFDGESGYDLASMSSYDVILLDLMLPKMDGVTVCKNLRNEGNHTPILMLTAKSDVEDKVDGLDSGADDYLAKPFAFDELVARIHALSRRPKTTQATILKLGSLTLNTKTFEATREGTPITLSKTEYMLLVYLMKNANQILTKEKIVDNVWKFDADILPNTVEVYIGYLRSKIDKPFPKSKKLIKTIRGFGYKISDV